MAQNRQMFGMDPEAGCSVCGAFFFVKDLDQHGRCTLCASRELMPGFKKEQDVVQSDADKRDELKVLIKEILVELKEEAKVEKLENAYAAKACRGCGKEFNPRVPAQAYCNDCAEQMKSTKPTE